MIPVYILIPYVVRFQGKIPDDDVKRLPDLESRCHVSHDRFLQAASNYNHSGIGIQA
jgi:hypothetical protein